MHLNVVSYLVWPHRSVNDPVWPIAYSGLVHEEAHHTFVLIYQVSP